MPHVTAVAACAVQAEAVYNKNNKAVQNMLAVVDMSVNAVNSRWTKYEELFSSVKTTVSNKFHQYMYRRGHQVGIPPCHRAACMCSP